MDQAAGPEFGEYVGFEEFRAGLPAGRLRVVVDPKLARRYVSQRLLLVVVLMPLIGIGVALALVGARWTGGLMVAAGVLLHRALMWQAGPILLHMAARDPACTNTQRRTACWRSGARGDGSAALRPCRHRGAAANASAICRHCRTRPAG